MSRIAIASLSEILILDIWLSYFAYEPISRLRLVLIVGLWGPHELCWFMFLMSLTTRVTQKAFLPAAKRCQLE